MRVATWNVNSIRTRAARVVDWLSREDIDVLGMQEIKCTESQFPFEPFEEAGYEVQLHGLNQWNGVAFASRLPMEDVQIGFPSAPGFSKTAVEGGPPLEARAIAVTVEGLRLWSLYVPNGRGLDDPHLAYKLDWLERLRLAAGGWLAKDQGAQIAMVGDWNVAPQDEDVWYMADFEGSTHVSAPERAAFQAILDAGFTDVARPFTPGPGVYTYWDYKQLSFPKRRGMRIDFVLGSPAFSSRVNGASIDREERKGKGASDHAPVIVELADR